MKSFLSVKQVVAKLNGAVSAKLIYKLASQGKLRCNRNLGKLLIEEDSLLELLEPRGSTVPDEPPPPKRPRGRPKKNRGLELW